MLCRGPCITARRHLGLLGATIKCFFVCMGLSTLSPVMAALAVHFADPGGPQPREAQMANASYTTLYRACSADK